MAGNVPTVGERVIYYVTETETVNAVVLAVTFWDLVDLGVGHGKKVIKSVRRVIGMEEGELKAGRFARILND